MTLDQLLFTRKKTSKTRYSLQARPEKEKKVQKDKAVAELKEGVPKNFLSQGLALEASLIESNTETQFRVPQHLKTKCYARIVFCSNNATSL